MMTAAQKHHMYMKEAFREILKQMDPDVRQKLKDTMKDMVNQNQTQNRKDG